MTLHLAIAGSPSIFNYTHVAEKLDTLTVKLREVIVLSNHAKGVSRLGEEWAYKHWWTVRIHHPYPEKGHDKRPPYTHHEEMLKEAQALVLFLRKGKLDPASSDLEERAKRLGVKTRKIYLED